MSIYVIKGQNNTLIGVFTDPDMVNEMIHKHDNVVCYRVKSDIELHNCFMNGDMYGPNIEKIYDKNDAYDVLTDDSTVDYVGMLGMVETSEPKILVESDTPDAGKTEEEPHATVCESGIEKSLLHVDESNT